jgi:hypothetical protein
MFEEFLEGGVKNFVTLVTRWWCQQMRYVFYGRTLLL